MRTLIILAVVLMLAAPASACIGCYGDDVPRPGAPDLSKLRRVYNSKKQQPGAPVPKVQGEPSPVKLTPVKPDPKPAKPAENKQPKAP